MNDEKSDEECEQAERREVQVEAVGQAEPDPPRPPAQRGVADRP